MTTLAERLTQARTEAKLTQAELAKAAGIKNQSTIGMLESGERKKTSYIPAIAEALGVEPIWLAEGRGAKRKNDLSPSSNTQDAPLLRQSTPAYGDGNVMQLAAKRLEERDEVLVPHLAISGSMGPGADLIESEEVIDRITLKGDFLRKNLSGCNFTDLAVISGKGNSMAPTFSDGDLLLVDCSVKRVDVDGVYVLSAHDRLFIKTVRQRLDGHFEISSDNPTVKTVDVLNGDHEVTAHGRVVWAWNGKRL